MACGLWFTHPCFIQESKNNVIACTRQPTAWDLFSSNGAIIAGRPFVLTVLFLQCFDNDP